MASSSLQTLQMLATALAPDQPDPGSQLYHFVVGFMEEPRFRVCHPEYLFPWLIALGDSFGINATGVRQQ